MYVLDTNILIYHAAGEKDSAAFFDAHATDVLYVPSVVAATALSTSAVLVTKNTRDFKKIRELPLFEF